MTLNKRYLRNVKENLSFYVAAAVLTVVALLLFYLFYIAGTGIKSYGDQFFIDNKLEDATFTTYVEIPDNEITNIEKKYNVTFEKEHYVNINEDGYKVRVFKRNKKIDLSCCKIQLGEIPRFRCPLQTAPVRTEGLFWRPHGCNIAEGNDPPSEAVAEVWHRFFENFSAADFSPHLRRASCTFVRQIGICPTKVLALRGRGIR